MTSIRISEFGGLIPKLDEKLLPPNCAVEAINVDLQGNGLDPLYAPLEKRSFAGSTNVGASMHQMPTACLETVGTVNALAAFVQFTPIGGNYVVQADDYLIYSVMFPADAPNLPTGSVAPGGIDAFFTAGPPLGNINDQFLIGSLTGDINARCRGQWYVRWISLASKVGSTLNAVRLYPGTTGSKVYFGNVYVGNMPIVGNTLTPKKIIFDVDQQSTGTVSNGTGLGQNMDECRIVSIDEDEITLMSDYVAAFHTLYDGAYNVCIAQLDGTSRNKHILVRSKPGITGYFPVRGWSNKDRWGPLSVPYGTGYLQGAWLLAVQLASNTWIQNAGQVEAIGWMGVTKPTVAPVLGAVIGGVGPVVTRSYVYTRVSEDGFESAPSPPVTGSGNRDGTWPLSSISAWAGTDTYNALRSPPKKRIYRTPENSDQYKFVAEIDAATVTIANDTALDDALGEPLATADWDNCPALQGVASWSKGIVGGISNGTQACFCVPYQYHAWPQSHRYTVPYEAVACGVVGDRFVVLTDNKPLFFSGSDPANLFGPDELRVGEPALSLKTTIQTGVGLMYAGRTGWCAISEGGFQNLTRDYMTTEDYAATIIEFTRTLQSSVPSGTVAMFDNRKLYWCEQASGNGYSFEPGAGHRALTKFQIPHTIYAMSYYSPRDKRWVAARENGGAVMKAYNLNANTAQRLKFTWKSKPIRLAKPERLRVGKLDSNEWDSLTNNMRYREGFYETIPAWVTATSYSVGDFVTQGGNTYRCDIAHISGVFAADLAGLRWILTNAVYTIDITGLTQSEAWIYLKVWAEADKATGKVLVFDDFVSSDRPVRFARVMKSDCWQFEIRGNIPISTIELARSEKELGRA